MADVYYNFVDRYNIYLTNDPTKGYTLGTPGTIICTSRDVEIELYNGKFILPQNASYLFAKSLSTHLGSSAGDTSECTDMSYMFYGCASLNDITYTSGDTSNVTNMSHMFDGCTRLGNNTLLRKFSLNIDTSNVTDMSYMFKDCNNLFTHKYEDRLKFEGNTSKLENAEGLFYGANIHGILDLSTGDTSNLKNASKMFYSTNTNQFLISIELGEHGSVGNLVSCSQMFYGQNHLYHIYIKENTDGETEVAEDDHNTDMFINCVFLHNADGELHHQGLVRANNTKPDGVFELYHPGYRYSSYFKDSESWNICELGIKDSESGTKAEVYR